MTGQKQADLNPEEWLKNQNAHFGESLQKETSDKERIRYIYKLTSEHLFNDDRLFTERMTVFLLSNSILFLGFVTLLGKDFVALKIALPIIGLILSCLQLPINLYSHFALSCWHATVRDIEKKKDFKRQGIFPLRLKFDNYFNSLKKRGRLARISRTLRPGVVWLFLPLLFCALWIVSLLVLFLN